MFIASTNLSRPTYLKPHAAIWTIIALSFASTSSLAQSVAFSPNTAYERSSASSQLGPHQSSVFDPSADEAIPSAQNRFSRTTPLVIAQAAQSGSGTASSPSSSAGSALPTNDNSGTATGKSVVRTLVDDAIMTTKIKAAMLADPGVKATEVGVETNSGEVTLSGSVDNPPAMAQAEKIAKNVTGVKSVVNNLMLKK